jgi:hypothetical protein
MEGTVPEKATGARQDIPLNKTTRQYDPVSPPDQIETQNHPVYIDPLGTIYCLDCPVASAAAAIKYPLTQ